MALLVKNPPVNEVDVRDAGLTPGWEDPLEEGMATPSSILPWRIPWTEEPGVYSSQGHKELDTTNNLAHTNLLIIYFLKKIKIVTNLYQIQSHLHGCNQMGKTEHPLRCLIFKRMPVK